ncbi:hypothetical protein JB92DRAFT_1441560 [Gautieria morchelliformis]|nr:hypothetical protein JB92DRAFT_1441560 [Gautieria morchelliformis]
MRKTKHFSLTGEELLIPTNSPKSSKIRRVKHYLRGDVDPERSSVPLAAYCFITGYVDSVTYTTVSVWCGFQTVRQKVRDASLRTSNVQVSFMSKLCRETPSTWPSPSLDSSPSQRFHRLSSGSSTASL